MKEDLEQFSKEVLIEYICSTTKFCFDADTEIRKMHNLTWLRLAKDESNGRKEHLSDTSWRSKAKLSEELAQKFNSSTDDKERLELAIKINKLRREVSEFHKSAEKYFTGTESEKYYNKHLNKQEQK